MEEDFCLLGLVADEPDYRLCWLLNRTLGTEFLRQDNLELYHKKLEGPQHFPWFLYEDQSTLMTFRIIRNRMEEGFFISELKNLDYLIHIQGDVDPERISDFIHRVNSLEEIRMCVPVDLRKIRNPERLYLW